LSLVVVPAGSSERVEPGLTPSDRDHDFEFVAVRQLYRLELAARHDLAIAFDRAALASEIERVNQSALRGPGNCRG
jgi:hypothetical protein